MGVSARLPNSLAAIFKSASWQGMMDNVGSGNILAGLLTQPIMTTMKRLFLAESGLRSNETVWWARTQSILYNMKSIEKLITKAAGSSLDWPEL